MSKAFTKESDQDESFVLPVRAPLPPGVKNYITSAGAQRLREEMAHLLASQAEQAKNPSQQREARIGYLKDVISTLVVADPPGDHTIVRFGATVTVQRGKDLETYRLVGVDETDLDRNEISWLSPLAKVLLGKRAGDQVRFRSPSGMEELAIVSVAY